jgi:hypothetical protein
VSILPDREVEDHVCNVVAYLKTIDNPNIKTVADDCGALAQHVYHRYHGRISRYDREGPNKLLSTAQEESICKYFDLLDDIGLSVRLSLVTRSTNDFLAKNYHGHGSPPTVSDMWPVRFRER